MQNQPSTKTQTSMAKILKNIKPTPLSVSSITPLNFDKPLSAIPPTHLWPSSHVENHPLESITLPLIDISNPKQKQLVQIRYACEEWGFFQIINHGVPQKLLDDFEREVIKLFSLPMKVKLRALRNTHETSGYGGVPVARFSPNKLWHEGFGIKKELREHASKLWPPHGNPMFCQVMEEYQQAMKMVAEKVMALMLTSLGLTPNDTNWAEPKTKENPFGPHAVHFQLNSYPICPDPTRAMGLTQHTDSSLITVLNQVNNVVGLQVLHKEKWVNVHPTPGSFVINSGDLTHFLFNGRFKSAVHRVIPSRETHRYSAAYFYGPSHGSLVSPLPKLVDPGSMPMYRTVTWEDYLNAKNMLGDQVFDVMKDDNIEDVKNVV